MKYANAEKTKLHSKKEEAELQREAQRRYHVGTDEERARE